MHKKPPVTLMKILYFSWAIDFRNAHFSTVLIWQFVPFLKIPLTHQKLNWGKLIQSFYFEGAVELNPPIFTYAHACHRISTLAYGSKSKGARYSKNNLSTYFTAFQGANYVKLLDPENSKGQVPPGPPVMQVLNLHAKYLHCIGH